LDTWISILALRFEHHKVDGILAGSSYKEQKLTAFDALCCKIHFFSRPSEIQGPHQRGQIGSGIPWKWGEVVFPLKVDRK
jgi:hypothetical protein